MSASPVDVDHIRVRYATFREHAVEERAALATRLAEAAGDERILLETCHRVELISVDRNTTPSPMHEVRGRDAVRRVLQVVAGFDSAVLAEEQLLGQARGAYEAALTDGTSGPVLNELFRRALRFGRRVRTHARPGTDRSLADRGVVWLHERLAPRSAVVVAGTGEMGRLVAHGLAGEGHRVTVVSGSAERGGRLVEQLPGGQHRLAVGPLTEETVQGADAVALAVRARTPMLGTAHLDGTRPWVLDLSSPGAADAAAADILGERLMSIDALGELAGATPVLAPEVERRLRAELHEEVDRFVAWLEARRAGDALAVLHGEANAVRRRHLDRLRRRAALDPEQLAAVEAASAAMLGELLHQPSVELRRGGADARTVRRLFGLDA